MDFITVMVLILVVCGVIWLVDIGWWAPKRRMVLGERAARGALSEAERTRLSKEPVLVEYARSFFPVILVVLLLRSFLVEPFRIPSGSMIPTLWVGDFILVNKFTYGIRLPVLNKKIIEIGTPRRGDIVVFRYPDDPSTDYIKRVIGLPGDHIEYREKTVYVNGTAIPQQYLGPYTEVSTGVPLPAQLRLESLPGKSHQIVVHPDYYGHLDEGQWQVPAGSYFVMGDNRDNSNDSRAWGYVPDANLVGRAFMIWMNWNSEQQGLVNWHRLGETLH